MKSLTIVELAEGKKCNRLTDTRQALEGVSKRQRWYGFRLVLLELRISGKVSRISIFCSPLAFLMTRDLYSGIIISM